MPILSTVTDGILTPPESITAGVRHILRDCSRALRANSIQVGLGHGTAPAEQAGPAAIARETTAAWITRVPMEGTGGRNMSCQTDTIIGKSPRRFRRNMRPNTGTETGSTAEI